MLYSDGIKNDSLNDFKIIFKSECVILKKGQFHNNAAHMLGARIDFLKNSNKLIIALGMLNNFNLPQDDNNSYGKILSFPFNLDNPINEGVLDERVQVHVKGIRNPQGLDYAKGQIVMSSHGPKGGDVINLIDFEKSINEKINFGFPIVSYGTHYDGSYSNDENLIGLDVALQENNKAPEYAPFYQDPKKYGFEEALKFYTPSVGPSQISFLQTKQDTLLVMATMGYRKSNGQESIHIYKLSGNEKINDSLIIPLEGRIRDLEIIDGKIWFWDETSSQLGVIEVEN